MSLSTMSGRERLTAAIRKQQTDRLPWSPLIDMYFISSLPEQGYELEYLEALKHPGHDVLERHVPVLDIKWDPCLTYEHKKDGDIERQYIITPVGSIYEEQKSSGKTKIITKHYIESIEDAKIFQYYIEHITPVANSAYFIERDNLIGDQGMATASGPMSPIQSLLQHRCGVASTVYLMYDFPEEMDSLMTAMHEYNKREYTEIAKTQCNAVFDYEDTSSTVMSRDMFEKYSIPCINEYSEIMQNNGLPFIAHMCGKLKTFSDLISACDVVGIDSVCPPTTGDYPAWDARKDWGESKVIIGGIEPPQLSRMTVKETLECVIEIIQKMPSMPGFILSTGDAVPYGTPMENLVAVTKLIGRLGASSLTRDFDLSIIDEVLAQ